MRLYSYCAKQSAQYQAPTGRSYHLIAYAGSDRSLDDAQQQAQRKLQERRDDLEQGKRLGQYPSGRAPLRENVLQRITDEAGHIVGAITRNRYSSAVLNTVQVMFLDVDNADLRRRTAVRPGLGLLDMIKRLFISSPPALPTDLQAYLERQLQQWLQRYPAWNFGLYRTRAGFRVLVTHALIDPNGLEAHEIYRTLPIDRTYARLCQNQACYRARLSPKPWRIGVPRPAYTYPYATAEQSAEMLLWEQYYTERSRDYAVYECLGSYGSGHRCSEAQQVQAVHDAACLGTGELA